MRKSESNKSTNQVKHKQNKSKEQIIIILLVSQLVFIFTFLCKYYSVMVHMHIFTVYCNCLKRSSSFR